MDITSFSCPSKDTILQNTMNKLAQLDHNAVQLNYMG